MTWWLGGEAGMRFEIPWAVGGRVQRPQGLRSQGSPGWRALNYCHGKQSEVPAGSVLSLACPWLRKSQSRSSQPRPWPPASMESFCFYLAVLCIPMDLAPRPFFLGKECAGPRGVPVWDGSSCTFLGRVSPRIFRLTLRVLMLGQTRLLVSVK